jgi:hypothetical protein
LLEAIDCAFNAIAIAISLTVKPCPLSRFIGATGNDSANAASLQVEPNRSSRVRFIACHSLRTHTGASSSNSFDFALLHQRLEHHRLVALSNAQQKGHGLAIAFTTEVNLGAKPTFAISQCFRLSIMTACTRCVLVRSNDTAIDKVKLSVKLANRIGLLLQLRQNLLPQSSLAPSIEAS